MKFRLLLATLMLATGTGFARAESTMISAPARDAVLAMGKTLEARDFSFKDHTIREYMGTDGQPLHIFHAGTVLVERPNRLAADLTGDDGTTKIAYDGKVLIILGVSLNKYISIPVQSDLEGMLKTAAERLGLDFPLADLLAKDPSKAFLAGVTVGQEVNTVMINGIPCHHLFFLQPPGIELELWVEKGEQAVPRRLIVTYRSLPGEPRFIAEMSDWNFNVHPAAADFTLQLPKGATKIDLQQGKKQ